MKKEILKIVSTPPSVSGNKQTLYLSSFMMEQLSLKEDSILKLVCGVNSLPVRIKAVPGKSIRNDILWLSEDIFLSLLIPEGITLNVLFADETIRIGPIIALLTENKFLMDYLNGTECVEEYSLYADAAEEVGSLVYVFSIKNLNLIGKYVNGYIPIKENSKWSWQKCRLPMPDVICNRMAAAVTSPAYKKIKLIEEVVPDIKIINRVTKISKWKIAELLQSDPEAKKYIPETYLFQGPKDIVRMLEKYQDIYLKPVRRSLGLGIIKMEKNIDGDYTAYYCIDGNNLKVRGDVEWLLAKLDGVMGKRSYIIQQGISVAPYEERPCDFRVTMQKGKYGEWLMTRWVSRVAAPGNIVSNVAAGGKGVPAEKVVSENFNGRVQEFKNKVREAGLVIAKALDKRLVDIGDLGLDIGIDMDGEIYLFEVNFRAIRPSNINSRDAKAWFRMYHTPIYYLKYLYDVEMIKKYNPQP